MGIIFTAILFAPLLLIPIILNDFFISDFILSKIILWGFVVTIYFGLISKYVFPIINKIALKQKLRLDKISNQFIYEIENIKDFSHLQSSIFKIFSNSLYCTDLSVLSYENNTYFGMYEVSKVRQKLINFNKFINSQNIINQKYINDMKLKNKFKLSENLQIIVKLEYENHILGIMLLNEKRNLKPYSFQDINFIKNISRIISAHIYRLKQITQSKKMTTEIIHEIKNTSKGLKYTVSELINNESLTGVEKDMLKEISKEMIKLHKFSLKHLEASKIDKLTGLEFKYLPLKRIIHDSMIACRQKLIDQNITIDLHFSDCFDVFVDETLIKILFLNIFENSILHSRKSEKIQILAENNNQISQIKIIDFGSEFSLDKKNSNTYWDENNNSFISYGIGLDLCKKIINKHKGKFVVASMSPHGTMVSIDLPRKVENKCLKTS